jgi:predicted ATPase/class 3 adenylate cyclase
MQARPASSDVPTGSVTFLFSDIEASTRRWERHGEAMRDALRRHDAILTAAIEARRGYIFKTIGDAFCAAFWSAGEALAAAVDAQRHLGGEDFGAIGGLYVRMAIHVGETDERRGDYFGVAVNRTARLLSAGHGGQILISGVAADLALPHLPEGVHLRHLGSLPLRDFKEPERVYQPVGPGLRSQFKALRALQTPPNNLPRQTTSFVGRHDDLASVEALLDEGGLLTIVGAGGIGKTRLALEVAAARVNDARDGAWFVDLSSIMNASLIAGTMLSALGAESSSDAQPLDKLLAYLEKRELLLILDNSEHLVSDVAAIVAQIVARCAHVIVLATSREPLDISSERIYRLSTLDRASAVQLFTDRARAADSRFDGADKTALVEDICGRLDGIALAIELAAARIRTLSVENLAAHLELRLLAGGRDRRPRQQTMRALIDWSYDLLAEEERRTLRRCSVFVRGFTLRAAADVCASDEWLVLDELASLVDKSLVITDAQSGTQRYRLLEPIREYAFARLGEAGELPEALRRHADTMASLAQSAYEDWERGPAADWLARLENDLPNFRLALRWSVEEANDLELGAQIVAGASPLFLRLSLLPEGIENCERVLQGVPLPSDVEARLRYGLSMFYSNIGENGKCLDQAKVATRLFRKNSDHRGLARALSQVASRYALQSDNGAAKPAAEEALELARDSGDRRVLADVLRRSAEAFAGDGHTAVRVRFEECVALFRSLGRDDETARALTWWGQWEQSIGNYEIAARLLQDAANMSESEAAMVMYASDIAGVYLAMGDPASAEPFARRSLALAAKTRHEVLTALAILYLAVIRSERDARTAAQLLGHARERMRAVGWELIPPDTTTLAELEVRLERQLGGTEVCKLFKEGAGWHADEAIRHALES